MGVGGHVDGGGIWSCVVVMRKMLWDLTIIATVMQWDSLQF